MSEPNIPLLEDFDYCQYPKNVATMLDMMLVVRLLRQLAQSEPGKFTF